MNLQEANALGRQLNDPEFVWPVGAVETHDGAYAVFEFMRYGMPKPSETFLMYIKRDGIPANLLKASGYDQSTAGYIPVYLYTIGGSQFMAIPPMHHIIAGESHDKPLVCVRFGCAHADATRRQVGRYAHDYTCNDCGHKWCIDSGD